MLYHNAIRAIAVLVCLSTPAQGEPVRVVTDIAPVHSLAALVMGETGQPSLLVEQAVSPHDTTLRPSKARDLERADIVFWVGPALTPWLERPLGALAPTARQIALLPLAPVHHTNREAAVFDGHEHDHEHEHGDDDPHAWLDPLNGAAWLDVMAKALAEKDPDNAATYRANAAAARAELLRLQREIAAILSIDAPNTYMTGHDALQYFEHRFGLSPLGAVASSDDARPGPRRIRAIRDHAAEHDLRCVFVSPGAATGLLDTAFDGLDAQRIPLDQNGGELTPGPALYGDMLRNMARAMATCLTRK